MINPVGSGSWNITRIAIGTFDLTSETYDTFPISTPNSHAQFLAIDRSGNIWFTLSTPDRLGVLTSRTSSLQLQPQTDSNFFTILLLAAALVVISAILDFCYLAENPSETLRMSHFES